jgi:phage FluMu gp28-like protein
VSAAIPGVIVKRDASETANWLATEAGFLEGLVRIDGKPLVLDEYQKEFLSFRDPRSGIRPRFRIVNKSRQVGFSFISGAESLARCHLKEGHRSIHVSYNLADAKEKITVAKSLYEGLPLAYQRRIRTDTKTELSFETPGKGVSSESRIISLPARPPRGKNGDIYYDELAHAPNDRHLYTSGTVLIARTQGQFTIMSTPLGQRGIFWEIFKEEIKPYKEFQRFFVPWWFCSVFCTNVPLAVLQAETMSTRDRVYKFGNQGLIAQYESLTEEDFQQEFECAFVDEAHAYFPYELILPCTDPEMEVTDDLGSLPKLKGRLVGGVDFGRVRDRTVISLFDEVGGEDEVRHTEVYRRVLHNMPFPEQKDICRALLQRSPIVRLRVDKTGLGLPLYEDLHYDFDEIVEGVDFNVTSKARMATNFKIRMEQRRIMMARDRDTVNDIHSIKRMVTAGNQVLYITDRSASERTKEGHADIFWAMALATVQQPRERGGEVSARSVG